MTTDRRPPFLPVAAAPLMKAEPNMTSRIVTVIALVTAALLLASVLSAPLAQDSAETRLPTCTADKVAGLPASGLATATLLPPTGVAVGAGLLK